MLRLWIHRIIPGKEDRLRGWLFELNTRAEEVKQSFQVAGVRAEQAVVIDTPGGSLLVYASEADFHGYAEFAFGESTQPIDLEHRAVMDECVESSIDATPLYNVSL